MTFINPLDSISEVLKSMGFEIEQDDEVISFEAKGAIDDYALKIGYQEKHDLLRVTTRFFDASLCILNYNSKNVKKTKNLDSNLSLLVSYANLMTGIGDFLAVEGRVYFGISLPYSSFFVINDKLAKKVIDTVVSVCDRFLPGFVMGASDDEIDFPRFSQLVDPCICVG